MVNTDRKQNGGNPGPEEPVRHFKGIGIVSTLFEVERQGSFLS